MKTGAAEQHDDDLVEHQNEREGRQHLVQMIAAVELADHQRLDGKAGEGSGAKGCGNAEPEAARLPCYPGARIGAHHVERPMGEVDHPHDAENQRQPGRQQKQHDAVLKAVQQLLEY